MPKHDSREPAPHDVIRAMAHRAAHTGARSVAIARVRSGTWTMVLAPEGLETVADAAPTPPALSFSTTDALRLVDEARARRGQGPDDNEAQSQPTLEAILRAGGEAVERAGQEAFLLVADHTGVVGADTEGKRSPIRMSRDEVAQTQRARTLSREPAGGAFHPGQRVWYLPRGAVRATPVVVRRLGAHQITVRFPSGDVAPVHRKWLVAEDPNSVGIPSRDPVGAERDLAAVPAGGSGEESPSIHAEALATSLAFGLDLGETGGEMHAQLRDVVDWLCEADPSDDAALGIPAGVRRSLGNVLSAVSSRGRVQQALLKLRPELHHVAVAGFPPAVQPAIESISAMDQRLDLLLAGVTTVPPAVEPSAAATPPAAEREPADPLTQALDEELAALREVATRIEAARNARTWLLNRQRMRGGTRAPRPEPGAEAPG